MEKQAYESSKKNIEKEKNKGMGRSGLLNIKIYCNLRVSLIETVRYQCMNRQIVD